MARPATNRGVATKKLVIAAKRSASRDHSLDAIKDNAVTGAEVL